MPTYPPGSIERLSLDHVISDTQRQQNVEPITPPWNPFGRKINFNRNKCIISQTVDIWGYRGPASVKCHVLWLFSFAGSHHTPSLPCPGEPSEQCACLHLKGKSHPPIFSWQEYLEILNNLKISWLICFVPFHKMSRIPICNTNEQPPIVLIPLLFSAERAGTYRNNWAFFL